MKTTAPEIRFKAKLLQPARPPRGSTWSFLVLPARASAKLPTRGSTSVRGTLNGQRFCATLEPDGRRGHWLKVPRRLRQAARARTGDVVALVIAPVDAALATRVPPDLRRALAATPKAQAQWSEITAAARRDWILWITTARREDTRVRRVAGACDMLAGGKRRVCCFDRSGIYGKGFRAPDAAN
jgi:Bacteriocin-protection, YdeI or OmpD-Associated/Domain of unknown function (DUF1905)